jgi:uncharacterized protein
VSDKPVFRFFPDAYERGVFVESKATCGACGRACVWQYKGPVYTAEPEAMVCARCVASGEMRKVAGDDYSLHDFEFDDDPPEALREEIEQRTPGFATFNPFIWPVRDGVPLAFLGVAEDGDLAKKAEVKAAMAALAQEMGGEVGARYALIFRTLEGDAYVATLDLD